MTGNSLLKARHLNGAGNELLHDLPVSDGVGVGHVVDGGGENILLLIAEK